MSNNVENKIDSVPETDIEMVDVAKATKAETELERCIRIFNQQQAAVDEKRQLVLDIFDNVSPLCLLENGPETKAGRMEQATAEMEREEKQMDVYQRSFHRKYPRETTFKEVGAVIQNEKAAEQAYIKMMKELPGLCFKYDSVPPMVSKAAIYTEVPQFIEHFEQMFRAHRVDIESNYQEALGYCLSSSVLNHYQTQRAALDAGKKESWTLAKEWLTSFGETPANTIAKWQTLLNLTHHQGESSASYFTRWRDALKRASPHKLTLEQLAAIVAIGCTPMAWRRKFHDELVNIIKEDKNSKEDLLDVLIKLDNNLVIDTHMATASKRSGKEPHRNMIKKVRSNPDDYEGRSGIRCGNKVYDNNLKRMRFCNEPYTPSHNEVCEVRRERKAQQAAHGPGTGTNETPVSRSSPHKQWINVKLSYLWYNETQ